MSNKDYNHTAIISSIDSHLNQYSRNTVNYYINNSFNYLVIVILIIVGLGFLVLPFIAQNIFPFHILSKIADSQKVIDAIGSKSDTQTFVFVIKSILFLIGILLFLIANSIWKNIKNAKIIRASNTLLQNNLELFKSLKNETAKIVLENGAVVTSIEPQNIDLDKYK